MALSAQATDVSVNKATRPLLGYYEKTGLLMTVDGALPTLTVFDEIVARLDGERHGHDQD